MSLTLLSLGSRGEVERQLSRQHGELRGITESVNMVLAKLNATSCEGSIYSKYTDDDVGFWRDLRRQLVRKGYRSRVIRSSESLILAYVKELDSRGVFNVEGRHSQLSIDAELNNEDSILPELGFDQVDVKADAQHRDEVSEVGHKEEDISGIPIDEASRLGKESTRKKASRGRQPTVEDFEQLSEFDQQEGGESSQPLNDSDYADDFEEVETWQREDDTDLEEFSPNISEYLEEFGRKEQEFMQTMGSGEDTANEETSVYNLQPLGGNCRHVNPMTNSKVHQPQAGDSYRSHLSVPRTKAMDNICTPNESSNQDIRLPLDREALAKAREEGFKTLSSEEKKVSITMQDPTGRKYSLPFFLVKTWDGMQYLIEKAFLNIEDMGPRVAKGEYDLINTYGAVIIPRLWETFVEPDMLVTMQMWPPPTPQKHHALPEKHSPFRVHRTSPLSVQRPASRNFGLPRPAPPRSHPRSSSKPRAIAIFRQALNTSQTSNHKNNYQNANRQFAKWPLFWPPSPSKAKPTKSRRPLGPPPPPPPPHPPPDMYMPSYNEDTYHCDCWDCQYPQAYSLEQQPGSYSRVLCVVSAPRPLILPKVVETATPPLFKAIYQPVTKTEFSIKAQTGIASDGDESVLDVSKVEPIFELEGEQIYELE